MPSQSASPVIDIEAFKSICEGCSIRELCLPCGMDRDDLERLDRIIERKAPLAAGDLAYAEGDPFRALFAVRSGVVKTYLLEREGEEHITGFHFPGELVGLDAIASGTHTCSARALDTTSLCEIPFGRLNELAGRIDSLREQLFRFMSREIHQDEQERRNRSRADADPRLAAFLLDVSERFSRLGFAPLDFGLKISNQDLASYLGVAPETISRLFRRFRDQGLATVKSKRVQIHDPERLRALACTQAGG
ncbi:transcriptional regulator [Thiohalorhabdus denitrificans]|uniref:CRP/FNR family transcriptional regulator, anaerobic regulatory protein n=1 Tax=Thiohalorhabdus denitrificans TaxID=381306 RepID=A0A0N8PMR1_9GAMM|nr:fumarate/nitrate reduction transcriptional regulator Fnr [Thiohalorhabdus denitrificans]KPV39429.1 transcriptional regulator [Thiohalorhabdus denitrificans]SCY03437.1 CRP/FNR family transcriptional regulator, anaerobic regulatory protein [Thiohalorhabdus denitrificans]